jgi:hypothetical protein
VKVKAPPAQVPPAHVLAVNVVVIEPGPSGSVIVGV